jgi:hypothetical protein
VARQEAWVHAVQRSECRNYRSMATCRITCCRLDIRIQLLHATSCARSHGKVASRPHEALAAPQLVATSLSVRPVHDNSAGIMVWPTLGRISSIHAYDKGDYIAGRLASDRAEAVIFPLHSQLSVYVTCKMVQARSIQPLLILASYALLARSTSVPLVHRQAANLTVATQLPTN